MTTNMTQKPYFFYEWVPYFEARPLAEALQAVEGVDLQHDLLRAEQMAAFHVIRRKLKELLC